MCGHTDPRRSDTFRQLGTNTYADWDPVGREAVALLSQYIQINTTNPPGNEMQAARFFKAIFEREGIEARIIESAPGRGNIYARLKGVGGKKPIILLNHLDVVPADRRSWSVDPFSGIVKDGDVWGRGALDMKVMGILELMTMLMLKRQGIPLKGDVLFLGTADEEAGGALGAGFIVRHHPDVVMNAGVVLNEGGEIRLRDGKVWYYGVAVSEKIPFRLTLTARSPAGHGSRPGPESAVTKLIAALYRIINYRTPLKVLPEVEAFYAGLAALEPWPRRDQWKNLKVSLQDPVFAATFTKDPQENARVRNTIAVTMLEGSDKVNVIPPQASAQIDVRLLPGEDPDAFLNELRGVIMDDSIAIHSRIGPVAGSSPINHELIEIINEVAAQYDPGALLTTTLLPGATDCRYFRPLGIPCYGFIPIRAADRDYAGVHGSDERVSVENVQFGTRMLYEIVRRYVAGQR
jgi:acetylornithine deacetylase/succinyl-diaminopimelate desuccinylase-like protein